MFAAALVAVSLAIDTLYALPHEGVPLGDRPRQAAVFRVALHGATFVLTTFGALAGFAPLRGYVIPMPLVALLGAASSLLALVAVRAGVQLGSFLAIAICLFAGSAAIAFAGGKLLGYHGDHDPVDPE